MTEKLQPELGSGALREALELMVKEWHWYAGKHGLGPARLQYALGVGERALSLSSPIEPPAICGVIGYPEQGRQVCELLAGHDGYHRQKGVRWLGAWKDFGMDATSESQAARPQQASSEIREADDAFVTGYEQGFVHAIAEAVEAAEKSDAVGVVESVVRNRIVERVRALAPSRQGAAKRVEG